MTDLKTEINTIRQQSKWILVAAARPNFMKIAPLMRAIHHHNEQHTSHLRIKPILVHTGQHYDDNMSDSFFRDLNIPAPDIHMGIGSGTHAEQTGHVLIAFEKILLNEKPDLVIVVGDVNSTMACTIAAVKLHIKVAHVEAGLRSFDRTMPEEINRLITDAVADYLFTPSPDGDENLLREGCPREKIFLVGNIMVDTLLFNLEKTKIMDTLQRMRLVREGSANGNAISYALLTLHRPASVDHLQSFSRILDGLQRITAHIPIIFPIHPRTRKQIDIFGLSKHFIFHEQGTNNPNAYTMEKGMKGKIYCIDPQGYLDFLALMANSKLVLTDSGGVQEETTVLNVPCITLRDTTERPITITEGTNVLVGNDPDKMYMEAQRIFEDKGRSGRCPKLWDGKAAERIVTTLSAKLSGGILK